MLLEGYFKNVEVINLGVCGFGVDQELLRLRSEGFRYEPDLVLAYVAHYADHRHMHAWRWGKYKPRFHLHDDRLVLSNSPVPGWPAPSAAPPLGDAATMRKMGTTRRIHWRLVKRSELYHLVRNVLVHLLEGHGEEPPIGNPLDAKNLENEAFRNELYRLGETLVYEMHRQAEAHGATFVLITQIKQLHEALVNRHVLSLDVTNVLSNPNFNLPDDLKHINESGNGALTWEIAGFLEANKLIPANHLEIESDRDLGQEEVESRSPSPKSSSSG